MALKAQRTPSRQSGVRKFQLAEQEGHLRHPRFKGYKSALLFSSRTFSSSGKAFPNFTESYGIPVHFSRTKPGSQPRGTEHCRHVGIWAAPWAPLGALNILQLLLEGSASTPRTTRQCKVPVTVRLHHTVISTWGQKQKTSKLLFSKNENKLRADGGWEGGEGG